MKETPNKERLSLLRLTKLKTIKTSDSEVIDLIEGEDSVVADEIEQADGYKEMILACLVRADRLMETPPAAPPTSTEVLIHPDSRTDRSESPSARVKLPKL